MSKVLSVLVMLMMVFSSLGFMAAGLAGGPSGTERHGPIIDQAQTTYGYGRMSRAYEDLSKWKGVNDSSVSVSYLIVVPDAYYSAAIPLGVWKTQKGLNTAIVTVDDIYQHYTGLDNGQKVHNYLRDFRANNPTFLWLLLLGDVDSNNYGYPEVPERHLWTGASYIDWYIRDSTISDFYYSALDSSWNLDNDNTWGEAGEVDWEPDVYVGRIPVDSLTEAQTNINKILKYEKDPFIGSWMNRALLAGALYDVPNVIGNYSTRVGRGYYEWWQDNGKEAMDVIHSDIPSYMSVKTLYDYNVTPEGNPPRYYGGNWSIIKDELNQISMINEFNKGNAIVASASHAWVNHPVADNDNFWSPGIIHYGGNGSEVEGQPNWFQRYKDLYTWQDARDANNMDMLPLYYASACVVGNFSQVGAVPEQTYEVFFKNTNGGGVIGLVAATHGDYRGEQDNFSISDGDTWLLEDYWAQFFSTGEYRPGQTLYLSKIGYRNHLKNDLGYTNAVMDAGFARDSMFVYNLLGDPEVPVWTNQPGSLSATIPPDVYTGPYSFEVKVKDKNTGLPVKGATVALWGSTQYVYGETDAGGRVTLQTNGAAPEKVNVTITAHNYKYMKHYLNITWKPADLVITSDNITFTSDLVKVGDQVTINAQVYNIGESAASNIDVKFYLGDPSAGGVEIGSNVMAGLAPHVNGPTSITWTAVEGIKTICVVVDPMSKVPDYNRNNNKACKTIEGTAKDLVLWKEYITFDKAFIKSDGTPMVGNGTAATIRVQVENKGTSDIMITYLRLFDGDPKAGGKRIGSGDYRLDNVPASGFANRTIEWNVTSPGLHTIFVIIDPNNVIKEWDENNNDASATVFSDLPPTMAVIEDIIIEEDGQKPSAFCLFSLVDDPDNTFDELTGRIASNSNPNIVVNLTNGCVDIFPKADFFGFSLVSIEVSDGIFKVSRTFRITITPVNDAPRVTNPGKVTAQEGVPFDLTLDVADPEGSALTFTDDSPLFVIGEKTGKMTFTPTRDMRGTHVIKVVVSDGEADTTVTFTIVVNVNNRPPTFTIKEKEWVFTVGKAKKYDFVLSDPDNDPITVTDNFLFADVSKAGYLAYTPTKSQVGNYNVTITATDGIANVTRNIMVIVKEPTKTNTIGGMDMMTLAILLVVIILVIAIIAAVAMRRSRMKEEGGTHDKAYNSLYAADEKQRERQEAERRREERMRKRLEEEQASQTEASGAAVYGGQQTAEQPEAGGASQEARAFEKCPKCGSPKIKQMDASEWMCMRCGKIFR